MKGFNQGLAAFLFLLIFLISFILYRLPVGAMLHPSTLFDVLGLLLVLLDIHKAQMKYGLLCSIRTALDTMIQILPETEGPEGAAYQQIIRTLIQEQQQLPYPPDTRRWWNTIHFGLIRSRPPLRP